MRLRRVQQDDAEVSMSPLIDCVFLLLIFFLVTTMLKKQDKDISIDLPDSNSSIRKPASDKALVLGIDVDGSFYFEGVLSTANDLHANLRDVAIENPARQIRVDVDKTAPFHKVVQLLDLLQFRGLSDVGIRTYDPQYNTR